MIGEVNLSSLYIEKSDQIKKNQMTACTHYHYDDTHTHTQNLHLR